MGGVAASLGSMKTIQNRATRRSAGVHAASWASASEALAGRPAKCDGRLIFPVRKEYNINNAPFVEFLYNDPLTVAGELICDVVKSWDDFHLGHIIHTTEDGQRKYTPDLSSGELWQRSDILYFGAANPHNGVILWFLVFIDDTCLVQRGSTSAKPIMITLGNFPEHIRNSPVSNTCHILHLLSLMSTYYRQHSLPITYSHL